MARETSLVRQVLEDPLTKLEEASLYGKILTEKDIKNYLAQSAKALYDAIGVKIGRIEMHFPPRDLDQKVIELIKGREKEIIEAIARPLSLRNLHLSDNSIRKDGARITYYALVFKALEELHYCTLNKGALNESSFCKLMNVRRPSVVNRINQFDNLQKSQEYQEIRKFLNV